MEENSFSNVTDHDCTLDSNSFSQELDSFERSFSEKLANLKKAAHSTSITHRSKSCTDAFYTTPKCSKFIEMSTSRTDENANPNTSSRSIDTYVFRSPNKRQPFTDITKTLKDHSPVKSLKEYQNIVETNNRLNEKIKKLESENKSLKRTISDLNKEKKEMDENSKEKENQLNTIINRLEKEIEGIKIEKEKIEKMKIIDQFQSNQNILFYTTKLESYERLYTEKENEINKLNEINADLENKMNEMTDNINQLKIENKDYRSESERMIEDLTYQNKSLEAKCVALTQMYEELKKEKSSKRNRMNRSPRKHHLTMKNNYSTVFETIFDYSPSKDCITEPRGSSLIESDTAKMYIHSILYFMIILILYVFV